MGYELFNTFRSGQRKKKALAVSLLLLILSCLWSASVFTVLCPVTTRFSPKSTTSNDARPLQNFAFAFKSGKETLDQRLSRPFSTFLSAFDNWIIVSDHAEMFGTYPVYDCYTDVYTEAAARLDALGVHPKYGLPDQQKLSALRHQEDGWSRDAHKNLPGFKQLYRSFPDKDWYMMIDDDSYVFAANLYDITEDLDHQAATHMGWTLSVWGCPDQLCGMNEDVVSERPDHDLGFYQGGAGILLSAGMMKLLDAHIDECILKSWDVSFGDGRVGLCMADCGFPLNASGPAHPYGYWHHDFSIWQQDWPSDPCIRPITGHRMRLKHYQTAFEAERKARDGRVTFADLYAITNGHNANTVREGWVSYGDALAMLPATSLAECQAICEGHEDCLTWQFGHKENLCWLKASGDACMQEDGYAIGMMGRRYVCHA